MVGSHEAGELMGTKAASRFDRFDQDLLRLIAHHCDFDGLPYADMSLGHSTMLLERGRLSL